MTTPSTFDPFSYNRAIRDSDLKAVARHMAMTLATYANKAGEAWPSQATLERGSGWSRRSVNNALDILEGAGWLTRITKGHKGRSTLYRLHLPGTAAAQPVCISAQGTVQRGTFEDVVTCTPTPQGEQHNEHPEGGFLDQPSKVPHELWQAAGPVLDLLLGSLSAADAERFRSAWPLAKARDFCWQLTALSGCNPAAHRGPDVAVRTPEELVGALTAVPLDDVLHVAPAMYTRLVRLAQGLPAVPQPQDPRLAERAAWAVPDGPVGDAVAALAATLSMDAFTGRS